MADFEIPGYEVYERLGRGGMATVFRALHLNLDREVAIKVMDPGMSSDETFSERFIREARISARLTHPHILQIYDVNTYQGMNYIAMELLTGGELADFIHGSLQQKTIYDIVRQMAEALDYASGRGYVHRDIKPSNIMMRSENEYVLADFGIARAANSGTQMTQTGLMVGTPSYMSPEQAKGQDVDGRSDIYALAVLIYEMLTKKLPYESDSAVTTAVKHLTEDIPTLPEHLAAYQEFINKAMAKKADDRYQTGNELYQGFMQASADFDDDQVLTEGVEKPASASETLEEDKTSAAWNDATRANSATPSLGSRPYKLESTSPRERLASGIYHEERRGGGGAVRLLIAAVVAGALGYGGYYYWQQQQGAGATAQKGITAQLASAYTAMNENDIKSAAEAFSKVLKADGSNAAAVQGMREIEAFYDREINQALQEKDGAALDNLILDFSTYFSSSSKLASYQASFELMKEEQNLAKVQGERMDLLLNQAREEMLAGDLVSARQVYAQAQAINPNDERLASMETALQAAEADLAMEEERWAEFSPEQRREYNIALMEARTALEEGQLDVARESLASAAVIVPDMPSLVRQQESLASAEERQTQEAAERQAALEAQLTEANAALDKIELGPEEGHKAVAMFKQVLVDYPENAAALGGLSKVVDYYAGNANRAMAKNDFAAAGEYLQTAEAVIPGQDKILKLMDELPKREKAHNDAVAKAESERQRVAAETQRQRELEEEAARKEQEKIAKAQAEARKKIGEASRAVNRGELTEGHAVYDEVAVNHADLPETQELKERLLTAYVKEARKQLDLQEFDTATDLVSEGSTLAPGNPVFQELQDEIDSAKSSSRRRLGAY
jgi:serine/threonine protein kinase